MYAHSLAIIPKTVESAARVYLDWYRIEHEDKPGTFRSVEVCFTSLLLAFGSRPLKSVTAGDLENYKRNRRRTVKAVTVRHDLYALSGLYKYAIRQGWCRENPVRAVSIPSDKDSVRIRVVSEAEEQLYLAAAKSHQTLHGVASLMLATGIRPDEALNLRGGDIEHGRIVLRKGKTLAARRSIRIVGRVAELVDSLSQRVGRRDFLFPGTIEGQHLTALAKPHNRACERAGVWFRIYDLRHTFATRMATRGVPLTTLAALLGHNGLRCVMRYVHPQQCAMDEAMERYLA